MYSVSDEITPWTLFFLHWGVASGNDNYSGVGCVLDMVGGLESAMEDRNLGMITCSTW
jgi:hypothetical protein